MVEAWVHEAFDDGSVAVQLELHLLPVVWLGSGDVYGAESFLRWRHPERGIVDAMAWLPHAIECGMLADLARSILPAWIRSSGGSDGPLVSFNLSGQQFLDEQFMAALGEIPSDVAEGLAIEVHHLQFFVDRATEIAPAWEWVPTPDLDVQLADLRSAGFSIWLDDYGDGIFDEGPTGHADINLVKLDRALLRFDLSRLTPLVERLHERGKLVMIEGVETGEHRQLVVDAGIELAQGFLYGWDMSEGDFRDHVAAGAVRRH